MALSDQFSGRWDRGARGDGLAEGREDGCYDVRDGFGGAVAGGAGYDVAEAEGGVRVVDEEVGGAVEVLCHY